MGLIIYCGIDENEDEIFHIIQPKIKLNVFYYNCGKKFITDVAMEYMSNCNGNIVFANGDECIIYEFKNGSFSLKKRFDALLQKRQKKGGQSAQRIARLAEETRHMYVVKIIDNLNLLNRDYKTVLFGSNEITKMILEMKTLLCPISYGGFLNFDRNTIKNTGIWIEYLKNTLTSEYDLKYKQIVEYLENHFQIDRLDFDQTNSNEMEFFICKTNENCLERNNICINAKNRIPFPPIQSQYYKKLSMFEYIGVKYFSYDTNVDIELNEVRDTMF
jgi:hypothetical protein